MTYEQAEQLFNRIRYGGELKLVSNDLSVDMKVKFDYALYWFAVKHINRKTYRDYRLMNKDAICTYIAQFDGERMEVANG
jgi:hypothetical protein